MRRLRRRSGPAARGGASGSRTCSPARTSSCARLDGRCQSSSEPAAPRRVDAMAVLAPHLKRRKSSDFAPKAAKTDAPAADPTPSSPDLPAYLASTTRDDQLTDISNGRIDVTD